MKLRTLALLVTLTAPAAFAAGSNGFDMGIVADGESLRELHGRSAVYVEALRNRSYEIRLTNPLGVRVAVALAVDGRNTIDAQRTSAWGASKWVLDPYESITIPGWQIDGSTARQFTFTTERKSYAAWLGDTSNLGVIEAVFYREKTRELPRPVCRSCDARREPSPSGMGAPAPSSAPQSEKAQAAPRSADEAEGYAATGMGDSTSNEVMTVDLRLDPTPVARVRIRYEFREQLVAMGLLPHQGERPPVRRERSAGFAGYCPQPVQR
jgi:hypothetical protein